MQVNDLLYHPASIDIIEFKVTVVHTYENHIVYSAKATNNVGACGRVQVLVSEDTFGVLRFIKLDGDYEYGNGLGDFIEGTYFTSLEQAKLAYYTIALTQACTNMEQKERLYKEAKRNYEKIKQLISVSKR